jgi:hypothetical protein
MAHIMMAVAFAPWRGQYYTSCADSGGATTGVSKRESGQALTPRTKSGEH